MILETIIAWLMIFEDKVIRLYHVFFSLCIIKKNLDILSVANFRGQLELTSGPFTVSNYVQWVGHLHSVPSVFVKVHSCLNIHWHECCTLSLQYDYFSQTATRCHLVAFCLWRTIVHLFYYLFSIVYFLVSFCEDPWPKMRDISCLPSAMMP